MRAAAKSTITGFTLLLFAAAPSWATRWVEFTPCGYTPEGLEVFGHIPDTAAALSYMRLLIDPLEVMAIVELVRLPNHKGPACTLLLTKSRSSRPVVGTYEEVKKKLGLVK